MKKNRKITEYLKLMTYVISIFIATWLLWRFVAAPTVVDGSSMFPTLANNEKLIVDKISYLKGDPQRFDIIVFREDASSTGYFIKRVIGLPGETVFIDKGGVIFIDGEVIGDVYGFEPIENRGVTAASVTLGEDEYFVLGDNRNNSEDSRYKEIGNIKRSDIYGRVFVRLTPFERFGYPDLYRERTEAKS